MSRSSPRFRFGWEPRLSALGLAGRSRSPPLVLVCPPREVRRLLEGPAWSWREELVRPWREERDGVRGERGEVRGTVRVLRSWRARDVLRSWSAEPAEPRARLERVVRRGVGGVGLRDGARMNLLVTER